MMFKKISERKSKQTIILLHGNSSSSKVFERVFDSDIPYTLVAFDLPGHGNSEHTGKYSFKELKKELIDSIQKIEGEKVLVGNSLGGNLILETIQSVKDVKGIVLFGAPPLKKPLNMEDAFMPNPYMVNYFMPSPDKTEVEQLFHAHLHNKIMIDALIHDFFVTDPKVRSILAEDSTNGTHLIDEYEAMKSFSGKKMILHGIHDPSVSLNYLESIKKDINADLKIIPDCGHFPSVEQPEVFIDYLAKFSATCFEN